MADRIEARCREDDRKVFRFDGTMDEFKAAMRAKGMRVAEGPGGRPGTLYSSPPPVFGMPTFDDGLEVHEIAGSIYVGTPNAIDRLREGPKIPVTSSWSPSESPP